MVTWVWDRDTQHLGLDAASETIQVTCEETEALGGAATWPGHCRGRCHDRGWGPGQSQRQIRPSPQLGRLRPESLSPGRNRHGHHCNLIVGVSMRQCGDAGGVREGGVTKEQS